MAQQEGYAAKYNVDETNGADGGDPNGTAVDPMQGLEGLAEAGPRMQ